MRRLWLLAPWLLLLGVLGASCSSKQPHGGLVVLVGTDMAADLDAVRIEVFEQVADGGWQPMRDVTLRIPGDAQLPTSFGILPGDGPIEQALIRVIAEKAGGPIVLREARVGVPTDRFAEVVLSVCAACRNDLRTVAGDAQTACANPDWSCQPATGACGPEGIDPASLATYSAGDESTLADGAGCRAVDAGVPEAGGDATPAPDADDGDALAVDASPTDAAHADATPADAGTDASGPLVWPNASSAANSDAWISAHHEEIVQMNPRVLFLNFDNDTLDPTLLASEGNVPPGTRFAQLSAAFAQASRYHGYGSPSAPPFLVYELAKEVDLTDAIATGNAPYHNSTMMPRRPRSCAPNCGGYNPNDFDYSALFSDTFAQRYGFVDPHDASRRLNLCELFQQGIVNEVWIYADTQNTTPDTNLAEHREYQQMYDSNDARIPGAFRLGFDAADATAVAACGVTIRMKGINPSRGIGCTLWGDAPGAMDLFLKGSIPSQSQAFAHFSNFDYGTRLGAPFTSWYDICGFSSPCVSYTGLNSVQWKNLQGDGGTGTFDPFDQGCGNVNFPPNATLFYDFGNATPVEADCEHFGLLDGPQGQDTKDTYTASKVAALEQEFNDCGGGWLVYWYESFPGLGNRASWGGKAIKNWWPYFFY